MVMLLDVVPEEPPGNLKICKRMKKRKQLDALHTNNKPNKRFKNSSFANGAAHGLLKNCSDSSDFEEYSVNTRRRGPKNHFFSRHMCRALLPITLFILVTACIVATATLVWLHLILRSNLEVLRLHLQKVESDAEDTPRTLHSIHSQIKKITTELDTLKDQLSKASSGVSKNEKELTTLHETSKQLKESLASAPEIHGLPKTIQSLSENLASIGSKILALETMVKDLKVQHAELTNSHQQQMSDLDVMKSSVHQLWKEVKTQKRNVAASISRSGINSTQSQLLTHLKEEVQKISSELGSLNGTLLPKANMLNNTLHLTMGLFTKQQRELGALREYVYGNLTSSLHNLSKCATIKNMFVNCNVTSSLAQPSFNMTENWKHLEELLKLYLSLKKELKPPETSSSVKEWLHLVLGDFFTPQLESISLQLGVLDSKTKNLEVNTDELKKEFEKNMGHLSNLTRLNASCSYLELFHSNLSTPSPELEKPLPFGDIEDITKEKLSSTLSLALKGFNNLSIISTSMHDKGSKKMLSTEDLSKSSPSATTAFPATLNDHSAKVLKTTFQSSPTKEPSGSIVLLNNSLHFSHSTGLSTESINFTSIPARYASLPKEKGGILLLNVSSPLVDLKDASTTLASPLLITPKAAEVSTHSSANKAPSASQFREAKLAATSPTTGYGATHSFPTLLPGQKTATSSN